MERKKQLSADVKKLAIRAFNQKQIALAL